MTRQFTATPGRRSRVPLFIGLAGASGSGKTFSALRLASGIQRVTPGEIYVVDTEAGRALHYADQFTFEHVPFEAPFGAFDYLDAIKFCVERQASSIIIDSASHMHEGQGGMLDQHAALLDRWCGAEPKRGEDERDWEKRRDRNNLRAWIAPKRELARFVQSLLQLKTNVIFCFRAKDKIKPQGGGQPLDLGTCAIADDSLIYEMTLQALLQPGSKGVPTWDPKLPGEKLQTKLPQQFMSLIKRSGQPLDESMGELMGRWAAGDTSAQPPAQQPKSEPPPSSPPPEMPSIDSVIAELAAAESTGDVAAIAARNRGLTWPDAQRAKIASAIKRRTAELQNR